MANPRHMKLQAFYTLSELAQRTDTTPRRVRRLLQHAGIPSQRIGGQRLVFTSDLEAHLPQLWASMIACERARAMTRAIDAFSVKPK
jgi:excisionase family DNA binding protein